MFGVRWYNNQQKIKWAQLVQIPAIQKMVDDNFFVPTKAFDMATELEKIIPGDSNLLNLWQKITLPFFYKHNLPELKSTGKIIMNRTVPGNIIGTTHLRMSGFR